jgi:hypothetical protein
MTDTIKVVYKSVDGARISRKFATKAGARRFAVRYVGAHPEIGSDYAVSSDGIGKVEVFGVALHALFEVSIQ